MLSAGIDIGSRSIELVVLQTHSSPASAPDIEYYAERKLPTTFSPCKQIASILGDLQPDVLIATGYGRKLTSSLTLPYQTEAITEIKAHALGAVHLFPQARAVLDIGGQDTKVITLSETGTASKFEMNDRCAAGTGKFLEHTANIFQIPVEDFGAYAMQGTTPPVINSMCTVFAETEATSLMAQGVAPEDIALGLHHSIVRRTVTMLKRIGMQPLLVFSGGVAHNPCITNLLCRELDLTLKKTLCIPKEPDMTGALGAALFGVKKLCS